MRPMLLRLQLLTGTMPAMRSIRDELAAVPGARRPAGDPIRFAAELGPASSCWARRRPR